MKLLIAILNHGLNKQALELKRLLGAYASVVAIDSGSKLSPSERAGFDLCLPNVFFGGCVRVAAEYAKGEGFTHVLLWASDVTCNDPELVVQRCNDFFSGTDAGVFAPSANYSFHRQMAPESGSGLARVTFTDGFCLAARLDLLLQTSSDFEGIRFGFGMDIHLGYLARRMGYDAYVDHGCEVMHPQGAGYSVREATLEWRRWLSEQPLRTRLFHRLAKKRFFKTSLGMALLLAAPWSLHLGTWEGYRYRQLARADG